MPKKENIFKIIILKLSLMHNITYLTKKFCISQWELTVKKNKTLTLTSWSSMYSNNTEEWHTYAIGFSSLLPCDPTISPSVQNICPKKSWKAVTRELRNCDFYREKQKVFHQFRRFFRVKHILLNTMSK